MNAYISSESDFTNFFTRQNCVRLDAPRRDRSKKYCLRVIALRTLMGLSRGTQSPCVGASVPTSVAIGRLQDQQLNQLQLRYEDERSRCSELKLEESIDLQREWTSQTAWSEAVLLVVSWQLAP
jgi:hypothetical protein